MSGFELPQGILSSIINASPVGMLLINKEGNIVFANSKTEQIFGEPVAELLKGSIDHLIPGRHRQHHSRLMTDYFNSPTPRSMSQQQNLVALRRGSEEIHVEIGLSPINIDNERYVLASIIDVSDRIRAQQLEKLNHELQIAATRDPLTGLANRRLLLELIEETKHMAIRNNLNITLMFIDIDGFKNVNDEYGHDVGDIVLRKVAASLRQSLRRSDIIGRVGGDEFVICLNGVVSREHIEKVSDGLIRNISSIREIDDHQITISTSIGIVSTVVTENVSTDAMIKMADRLMYQAKKSGKGKAIIKEYQTVPDCLILQS